jgi:soluble lytic murein transglycosylase-like protein
VRWLFSALLIGCSTQAEEISSIPIEDIPQAAKPYVKYFDAENLSRELAQTEQESAWNPNAQSPYAKGLRQFTDSTGQWMARTKCRHLGSYQPFNPEWSIRCGVIYQESLQQTQYGDYCNNRKVAEQIYNGGYWVKWELKTANSIDLKDAEQACYSTLYNGKQRKDWACKENYEYPERISKRQIKYKALGGQICA